MDSRELSPEQSPGNRWVIFGLWSICGVTGFMVVSTLGILLPSVSAELHLSPGQQGLLGSAAFWGSFALAIPLSWWTSRYDPKTLSTVTMAIGVTFLLVQGWAPVFGVLLFGRLAFGITFLAREPSRAILMQQWFPPREVILANGLSNALFGLVVGGGFLVTPFILDMLGDDWRGALFIFAALLGLLTVLWAVIGKSKGRPEARSSQGFLQMDLLKVALAHRDLWVGGFGFLGANLAWAAFLSFFPTLMLDAYDVSLRWSGAILALGIVMGGVAGVGASYLVMVTGRKNVILHAFGIIMTVTYLGMTMTSSLVLLLPLAFLNGVAWGFWPILYTVPFQLPGIRPRETAVALAFTMVMISAGTMLGPLLTGYLQELIGDLKPALLIVSFASLSLNVAGGILRVGGGASEVGDPAPSGTQRPTPV